MQIDVELLLSVFALLATLVPLYYAYRLYRLNVAKNLWLVVALAMALVTVRRVVVIFTQLNLCDPLDANLDSILLIATLVMFGGALWSLETSMEANQKDREAARAARRKQK